MAMEANNDKITAESNGATVSGTLALDFSANPELAQCTPWLDGSPFCFENPLAPQWDTCDVANGIHELKLTDPSGETKLLLELLVENKPVQRPSRQELRELWDKAIGTPAAAVNFTRKLALVKTIEKEDFTARLYRQNNGPGTWQRVLIMVPKQPRRTPAPGIMIPFYVPEDMAGMNLENGEPFVKPGRENIAFGRDLVKRGYVVAMSESYHVTLLPHPRNDADLNDFSRWERASRLLYAENPHWTGMGKLVADTSLAMDVLLADPAVDKERIGIIGHSLGGKMAFYTGCLDQRVKVMVASDFGIGWEQTNWSDNWYWGKKLAYLRAAGMEHSQLLASAAPKPLMILAGLYDNQAVNAFYAAAKPYYDAFAAADRLQLFNHASGHRPTPEADEAAYAFLDKYLMEN